MKSLDHVNIDNENFLYFILNKVDGYIKRNIVFTLTDENKEALKKYTKLWNETKSQIEIINGSEPAGSLVVSNLRSDTKGFRFESGC